MITIQMLEYLALFTKADLIWALKKYHAAEKINWSNVSANVAVLAVLKIVVKDNLDLTGLKKLLGVIN